ncbi:MAG TPA: hypothetical protein HA257_07780 [Candidatus Methanoperedenaceae archaeon]|nr:hypothetical protein [Candidatus Methanoperedenaceae archaeon]
MPKELTVTLTDTEYEILSKMTIVAGEDGEKLRNLFRYYVSTIPELRSSEYALKRAENKEELDAQLKLVWESYEDTDNPMEKWDEARLKRLYTLLLEINAIMKIGEDPFTPSNKFRGLFKMLLHDVATESKDMDEYSAACIATIQLLQSFSSGTLSKEDIRDCTILINEGWLFAYATAMKRAREFMKTKRKFPEIELRKPVMEQV